MKSTDERLNAVHERVYAINRARRIRQNRLITAGTGFFCLVLLIGIAVNIPNVVSGLGTVEFDWSEHLGSIFYNSALLSYILIAFFAFLLGVSFTLLCVFLHKRSKNEHDHDDNA